jgi:hypothetical protein
MGLAATTSPTLKNDLTALSTIPNLFILQRMLIPLKIHQAPPEPIVKGRYGGAWCILSGINIRCRINRFGIVLNAVRSFFKVGEVVAASPMRKFVC